MKLVDGLDARQAALMQEACERFGIDPDPEKRPIEVMAFRFYGDPQRFEPLSLVIVTAGGLKLRYPIDPATEDRLRPVFGCFRRNARTGQIVPLPLPKDLRLSPAARTGMPPAQQEWV
jgi:hypothetical protein